MHVAAAPVLRPFQLLRANSDIIHQLIGVVYTRLHLLSVNRSKIVWTTACWCTCSWPLFGVERCLLVGGWFCIVAMGNAVGTQTLVHY